MNQVKINFKPFPIQYKALKYLFDNKTTEIFFGGAARVSKSYLAVAFATISALQYPGIHIGISRSRLSLLKKSTFITLLEFFTDHNIIEGKHYRFNGMDNILTFNNGSRLFFLELYDNPSDANFDRLGSLSLTHCIIDEASQISKIAYDTLAGRISYKLYHYGIKGKMLIVSNPTQGWLKERFYTPYINGELESHQAVILGLPTDNPTAGQEYVERNLKIMSDPIAQRLIYGNWDYSDEDYNLFRYDDLVNCFYNDVDTFETFLSADIADIGGDRTVIIVWQGMKIIEMFVKKCPIDEGKRKIQEFIKMYRIRVQNVVIDADGMGIGVSRDIKGCYLFKNGSKALNNENYRNLKTQCTFKLKDVVEKHEISFLEKYREDILKEFQEIKYDSIEKDRIEIESKGKMKKRLGKSPDIFDAIMMRFVYEIKQKFNLKIA